MTPKYKKAPYLGHYENNSADFVYLKLVVFCLDVTYCDTC